MCGRAKELGETGQDGMIQCPDVGAEIGTPPSQGTQRSHPYSECPYSFFQEERAWTRSCPLGLPGTPHSPHPQAGEQPLGSLLAAARQAHCQTFGSLGGWVGAWGRLTSGPHQVRGGDTEAEQWRQGRHGRVRASEGESQF